MARNILLQILRTARAALNSAASANGLTQGEPYLITDENRLAVGTGASTYSAVALQSELAGKADASHTQAASTISDSTTAGRALLTAADVSAQRTALGLVIGTNVQAQDAELAALAGLTSAADRLPYFTGSGTASLATFTAAGRALLDDADAAAQRTTLGLGTVATTASTAYATASQGVLAGTALQPLDYAQRLLTLASDAGAGDSFGGACAISADGAILAIGAQLWDGVAGSDQGAVYIYDWNGSAWVQRSIVTASDAGASDYFGGACALSADGTVLGVGAQLWDGVAGSGQGAVYIYDWNGSAWVERTTALLASNAVAGDRFGWSITLSSDGAILGVGAPRFDGAAGSDQGAFYVFDWTGSAWVERTTALTPSDAGASDYFGGSCAVSADGSILAVGAYGWDSPAKSGQGAVYIYDWNDSIWVQRSVVTASNAEVNDYLGTSCALSADGSILAIGAASWDGVSGSGQGAVYIYDWNGSAWVERITALTPLDAEESDSFGTSCALSANGAILAIGATGWTGIAGSGQGAIYTFSLLPFQMLSTGHATAAQGALADSAQQPDTSASFLDTHIDGTLGVGVESPSAKSHIVSTTEQLRLGYDATKYASLTVDADGFMAVASGLAETPVVANTSTAYTITAKSLHDLTLTGTPVVFTFPTATAGRQFTLLLKQDATGTRLVTWPASVRWAGGTAPTLTTTAAKTDVISFIADGTYWLGFVGSLNFTRA